MTSMRSVASVSCVHIVWLHFAFGRQPWEITRTVCLSPQVRLVDGSGLLLKEHGHTMWEWFGSLLQKCSWFTVVHRPKARRKPTAATTSTSTSTARTTTPTSTHTHTQRMVLCSKLGHQLGADVWMLGTLNSNLTPFGKTLMIYTTLLDVGMTKFSWL